MGRTTVQYTRTNSSVRKPAFWRWRSSRYVDPFLVIGGDLNKPIAEYLDDFPDLRLVTRQERVLDLLFTNFPGQVVESGMLDLLEYDSTRGSSSDHKIPYLRAELKKKIAFEWIKYSYQRYSEDGAAQFGRWLAGKHWSDLLNASTSDKRQRFMSEKLIMQ